MALSEKVRLEKLSKATTGKDFHDLYFENFGEEFPIIGTLDPDEKMEILIDALENNEKVKELTLGKYTNI